MERKEVAAATDGLCEINMNTALQTQIQQWFCVLLSSAFMPKICFLSHAALDCVYAEANGKKRKTGTGRQTESNGEIRVVRQMMRFILF